MAIYRPGWACEGGLVSAYGADFVMGWSLAFPGEIECCEVRFLLW